MVGGVWSEVEKQDHINLKELKTAVFGLKMFTGTLQHTHIRLQIDNTTAVAYVNAQRGRKPELNEIARDMWNWAIERDLWLSAVLVPEVDNREVDRPPSHNTRWRLSGLWTRKFLTGWKRKWDLLTSTFLPPG